MAGSTQDQGVDDRTADVIFMPLASLLIYNSAPGGNAIRHPRGHLLPLGVIPLTLDQVEQNSSDEERVRWS